MATSYSPFSITSPPASSYIGGVRPITGPAAGYPAPPPGYGQDRVGVLAAASSTASSSVPLYPINLVVDDPSAASHLKFFFIGSASSLLKVGASPLGRSFLGLFAGAVPLFTPSAQASMIRSNVTMWVNRADMTRAGMDPMSAKVLQSAGVMGVADLARYASPMDQAMLAAKAAPIAAGMGIAPPNAATISLWVRTAQQLPPVIR